MPIYMQMGPADKRGNLDVLKAIKGTSKANGYEGWLPVKSCNFVLPDRVGNPKDDVPWDNSKVRKATCFRTIDGTSTTIFKMAFSGSQPMVVLLDFVDGKGNLVAELKLSSTLLSGYSTQAGSATETFSLDFSDLKYVEKSYDDEGKPVEIPAQGYDPSHIVWE